MGRDELLERQQHLNNFLRGVQKLVTTYGVAAIVTNEVVANVAGNVAGGLETNQAAGGFIMSHAATTCLELSDRRANKRMCRITKSPALAEKAAEFFINTDGIGDLS